VITLNKVIETGKSSNVETDRHMHLSWDQFRRIKEDYERLFDQLICTDPDRVRSMHEELVMLSKEVELGWNLKQDQLEDLTDILHHENYNATGLSTGNDGVDQLCEGLTEYIEKVNKTAWEVEKPELDEHLQEVEDIEIAIATHPCPCVWSSWEGWSECSTTCEAGSRNRQREIEKEAINNGAECVGEKEEIEACNEDVCCPVNCMWGAWEDWGACPSGCDQEKTRIRQKMVMESCNGIECTGKDYEKMSCSRERELEDEIKQLEQELDTCQQETSDCPPGWIHAGAHPHYDNYYDIPVCFLISHNKMNWTTADEFCAANGGYLAEITSPEEKIMIESVLDTESGYWLGLTDREVEGKFVWQYHGHSTPPTWTDWLTNQPSGGEQDCASLVYGTWSRPNQWGWDDDFCWSDKIWLTKPAHALCQLDIEAVSIEH